MDSTSHGGDVVFQNGGRQVVVDAELRLVSTSREEGRTTLSSVLRETFSTDAFLRRERTAAIVDLAVTELDERNPDDMLELTAKLTGRLSEAEMASVIPWVIKSRDVEQPPISRRQLGALFTFEDLEKVARLIAGDDVSELIRANAEQWYVRRAQVEPANYDDVDRVTQIWKFLDGVLTVDTDYHRASLSTARSLNSG